MAAVVSLVVVVVVQREPGRAVLLSTAAWLDGFVHSPGLGGVAATVGSAVALAQWRRQAASRSEDAATARRTRRDTHWWETYRSLRTGEPTTTYADRRVAEALLAAAETEMQGAAAAALLTTLPPPPGRRTDSEEGPDDDRG